MPLTRLISMFCFFKHVIFSFNNDDNHLRYFFFLRYRMVFVPFTAIDNHRKCVTVGSGLLKNETTESYIWLLQAFKKAFVRSPNIIVTDQDGAMRNAIAEVLPDSKHRLCMWHIMQKLPAKVSPLIFSFLIILINF